MSEEGEGMTKMDERLAVSVSLLSALVSGATFVKGFRHSHSQSVDFWSVSSLSLSRSSFIPAFSVIILLLSSKTKRKNVFLSLSLSLPLLLINISRLIWIMFIFFSRNVHRCAKMLMIADAIMIQTEAHRYVDNVMCQSPLDWQISTSPYHIVSCVW